MIMRGETMIMIIIVTGKALGRPGGA